MPEALESEFAQLAEYFREDRLRDTETYGSSIEAWARSLPTIGYLNPLSVRQGWNALAFIHLGPRGPLPGVPWRPSYAHGHLPFHGTCGGTDKYYRYEQFPKSIRIVGDRVVKKDTYAAPESERDFTPTGLSAVGRFALPLVLPACWRYELTPANGTKLYYGASVPLYGQSGGAVEVMFPDPFQSVNGNPPLRVLSIL